MGNIEKWRRKTMTLSEAKKLRFRQTVYFKGEHDSDGSPSQCRVNGKVQTWKTRPAEVKVPVKRGLYEYGYITHNNLHRFTLKRPASISRRAAARR